ncbi:MAG TPA: hypothetical protein VKZ63_03040, partial [Kofleriaceae bacterium]|nr:hypothetical protein [Kofleriaceae bacterium]
LQVLRRLAKLQPSEEPLKKAHQDELQELVDRSPAGERLLVIDQLKQPRGSASLVAQEILRRSLKASGYMLLGAFLAGALWFVGFHSISTMTAGFGFKAVLFLTLNFLFLIATVAGLAYFLLRPAGADVDSRPRWAARTIARTLDVPIVTFGHTHDEVIARLETGAGTPAWYFNTGTWIAVFTADSLLPRERVQYTFLRVRGNRGELLHWSPGRKQAAPVILLEEDRDRADRPSAAAAS